jgi:hypothetical protein
MSYETSAASLQTGDYKAPLGALCAAECLKTIALGRAKYALMKNEMTLARIRLNF